MTRDAQRLNRQLDSLSRHSPAAGRLISSLRDGPLRWVRIPVGLLLIAGGFLAVLPVFGLWMIPLGLVVLALDIPLLQSPAGRLLSRLRQAHRRWRRRRD